MGFFSVPALCLGLSLLQSTDLQAASLGSAGGTPAANVDLEDAALLTTYHGVINNTGGDPVGTIEVRVSRRGKFSARVKALDLKASGRGGIDSVSGEGTGTVRLGRTSLPILFQVGDSAVTAGTYYLDGEIQDVGGATTYTFSASPAAYTSRQTPPEAGSYTLGLLGAADVIGVAPAGDGAATGKVSRGGRVSFSGYHSNGTRFSSRASILEGNCMVFYATIGRDGNAVGELVFQNVPMMSDFDGEVFYTKNYSPRGIFPASYSFTTNAIGNLWTQGMDVRTAMNISTTVNNAVLRLTDGPLDGQDSISTVDIRGRMTVPKTQTLLVTGSVGTRNGVVKSKYKYSDPATGYSTVTNATIQSVVLPKMGETRGNYTTPEGGGAFELVDNVAGDLPPLTAINPRVKAVSEFGIGYQIQITTSEPWSIEFTDQSPEGVNWVSFDVTSGDGGVDDPRVINALVTRNTGYFRRDALFRIAGQPHAIVQSGSSNPTNTVEINPESQTVGILGATYFVQVIESNPGTVSDAGFFSPVDWVGIQIFRNPLTGLIEGAYVTVAEPTGGIGTDDPSATLRSASILIAGEQHFINQVFSIAATVTP